MKRTLAIIIAVVLVVALSLGVSIVVSATDTDPTIAVSSGSANNGGTRDITISVKNNPGIASLKLKVEFSDDLSLVPFGSDIYDGKYIEDEPEDKEDVQLFDEESNLIAEPTEVDDWVKYDVADIKGFVYQPKTGTSSFKNIPAENKTSVTLIWVSPYENIDGDFTFATLRFKVSDEAELGDKDITVNCVPGFAYKLVKNNETNKLSDYEDIDFQVENGKIEVTDVLKGDADGNGKVNMLDVTYLRRYLAKWDGYELGVNINKANADIDGNGKVNMLDVTYIRRHLAKWDGYEDLNSIAH